MRRIPTVLAAILATILATVGSTAIASPAQALQWSPSINECLVFRPLLVQNTTQHACTAAWQGFLKFDFPRGIGQTPTMAVDGQFGPVTALATARFQLDRGLEGDGKVGPLTWGRIQSQCDLIVALTGLNTCNSKYTY